MKKLLCSFLLLASVSYMMYSCSSGAYVANPGSPANQSINPLNPLKANQFTWSGNIPFSADINGARWVADTAWIYEDTSGTYNIIGYQYGTASELFIHFPQSWPGNVYNMGYQQPRYALFIDSLGHPTKANEYYSYLGNSGELYVTKVGYDTLVAKFYFQGVSPDSGLINVTNGYINLEY